MPTGFRARSRAHLARKRSRKRGAPAYACAAVDHHRGRRVASERPDHVGRPDRGPACACPRHPGHPRRVHPDHGRGRAGRRPTGRRRLRGRRRSRPAPGHPDRRQGHHRHQRCPEHRQQPGARSGLGAARRRHRRQEAARGRRRHHRQDGAARVRARLAGPRHRLPHPEEPVGPRPDARWIEYRHRRRRRRWGDPGRPWHLHRRLDPGAGSVFGHQRHEADVRARQQGGLRAARLQPGPHWSDGPQRPRLRGHAPGDGRPDPLDLCSVDTPVPDMTGLMDGSLEGVRIGVLRDHFFTAENLDPEVKAAVETALEAMAVAGATLVDVSIPHADIARHAQRITMMSEAYAYHEPDLKARPELYGKYLRESFQTGALYTAADYIQAQRLRPLIRAECAAAFGDRAAGGVDVLVTPTMPITAPTFAGYDADAMLSSPTFTAIWNLVGLPAISVPCGFSSETLPIGIQLVGRPFDEPTVFKVADAYQQITDWHLTIPDIAKEA